MASRVTFRSAGPFLALAAASLALDAAPQVPWTAGVAGAGLFAAAAAGRRVQNTVERRTARRVADDRIMRGHGVPHWREQELTSARARAARRRQIERVIRSASGDRLPSASPVNRGAVRASSGLLHTVAARLADDRPVAPRGVLYVDQLLGDPASPLYGEHAELLPRAITRVLGALDE